MQELPRTSLHSQVVQESADPESPLLARVYALILSWPLETRPASLQSTEANASQADTGSEGQQDSATETSTLTTE